MSDKSFEQKVREELSDLRMKPNAAVWDTVAASLKKEKKRRWVLWMFLLLAGLSGASIWWMTQPKDNTEVISQQRQQPQNNESKTILSSELKVETEASRISNDTIKPAKVLTENTGIKIIATGHDSKSLTDVLATRLMPAIKKDGLTNQISVNEKLTERTWMDTSVNKVESEREVDATVTTGATNTSTTEVSGNTSSQNISTTDSAITLQQNEPKKVMAEGDSLIVKKEIRKNKWQWRAGTNFGVSGIRNSLGSLFERTNENAYNNAYMGNASPITGPPGSSGSVGSGNNKPVVRDAYSFGAFLELARPFGKRLQHAVSFTSGYQLYTTRTGIGAFNNDTVQSTNPNRSNEANSYYSIKDSASYTSNYHFLQLGIRYAHSLNWFKKADMHWYGGIGANILIAGNGLHLGYHGSGGTYLFQNKSLIRSVQMDISVGIDIGLGKTKTIYVGPQVQYFLSNLSKQPGVNQHLFRPSIRMSLNINRKNK